MADRVVSRHVVARLARLSIRATMMAGGWVGFALGLLIGSVMGAFVAWLVGGVLDWQRQASYTLGISVSLVPFGDRRETMLAIQQWWFLVIPATGIGIGIITALFGALIGGLIAASYNRGPGVAHVLVELPSEVESTL